MKLAPHLAAAVATIVAVVVFLIARASMDFQFGVRTYWPVFLVIYLVVWYFTAIAAERSRERTS